MTPAERREEWLKARRRCITSGDVPLVLGIDGSPMQVWLSKMGMDEPVQSNERMEWGLRLQRAIIEGYADREQRPIAHADPYQLVVCPQYPLIGATLDARCLDGDQRPVDAKNIAVKHPALWGPDGSDVIPDKYALQLHVQMMVTGTKAADLAVLFGGNHLEVFHVEHDPEIEARIVEAVTSFWDEYVLTGVSPPPDSSEAWRAFLRRIRQENQQMLASTAEVDQAVLDLARIRIATEALNDHEAELEATIKSFIGPAAGTAGPSGKVTWRQTADRSVVDHEAVVRSIAATHPELQPEIESFVTRYTERRPGPRRFLLSAAPEKDEP